MSQVADLSSLVPGLREGRPEAYRSLVQFMGEPLLRYAATILKDSGAAEDVVQDALLRVYRLRGKLRQESELRGLCFRMVRNLARNQLRDRGLRSVREQEAQGMRDASSRNSGAELALEAWSLVAGLAKDLREVVDLRFRFGLSRSEIATALQLPEGTVATRQRTALETLRERMVSCTPAPLGIAELSQLLADPAALLPSAIQPLNIAGLEDSIMAGISTIRRKAAGLAVAALLVALVIGSVVVSFAVSLTSGTTPVQTAAAPASATGKPGAEVASTGSRDLAPSHQAQVGADNDPKQAAAVPVASSTAVPANPLPGAAPALAGQGPVVESKPDPAKPVGPAPIQVAPEFLSQPVLVAVAGQPYEYVVQLAGTPAALLSSTNLPGWLSLDGMRLHGTPARKDSGVWAFTLVAANGASPVARQAIKLVVNTAPVFKNSPDTAATAGSKYTFEILVDAQPAATLSLANAPAWLSLKGNTLAGTPTTVDAGLSPKITLTASNTVNPDAVLDFTIEVSAPPEFTSAAIVAVKVGSHYSYKVTARGYPAPALDATGLPKWLTFANGELSGDPRNADLGKSRKITLRARNGLKPDAEQSFAIDVQANADYVELPWDVDDMKRYFKVGLKWKLKGSSTISDSMGGPAISHDDADQEYEVTAVDNDGFTVKSIFDTGIGVSGTTVTRTTDSKVETIKWADAMAFARRSMPVNVAASTTRKETTETLTLMGKSYKCTVYTWTEHLDNDIEEVRSIYWCAALPFGAVRYVRSLTTGKPGVFTNTSTFTQSLSTLVAPKK